MRGNDRTLLMENAEIMWRNFSGKEGPYNREGDRNFCVRLTPELAEDMARDGWNIKEYRGRDEGEPPTLYIQVSVGFKNRPPRIVMVTSRGRTTLLEDEVELLDWVEIENVDLIINPYSWSVGGRGGVKAYVKSLFVTIHEDYLDLKYANIPEIGGPSPRQALESHEPRSAIESRPHYDIEGDVV